MLIFRDNAHLEKSVTLRVSKNKQVLLFKLKLNNVRFIKAVSNV